MLTISSYVLLCNNYFDVVLFCFISQYILNLATDVMDMTGVKYTTLIPSMEIQMGVLKSVIAYPTTIFLDENGNQLKVMEGSRSKSMWIDTIEEVIESEK